MYTTYNELTDILSEKLRSNHYCDSTVQKYQHEWKLFKTQLSEENASDFTIETVKAYFFKKYGVDFNRHHPIHGECDRLQSYQLWDFSKSTAIS